METVKDNYINGIWIGLLLPFIGFIGFYQWKFSLFSFQEFISLLVQQKSILSSMISVSLLLNGALLTLFFQREKDKIAKGIFFTTCIYALVALVCKWLL